MGEKLLVNGEHPWWQRKFAGGGWGERGIGVKSNRGEE